MTQRRFLALWSAGICVAMLGLVLQISRSLSAQDASTQQARLMSAGFAVPEADEPCILSGNRLNLQCIVANDPDAQRIRAEEAGLEARSEEHTSELQSLRHLVC